MSSTVVLLLTAIASVYLTAQTSARPITCTESASWYEYRACYYASGLIFPDEIRPVHSVQAPKTIDVDQFCKSKSCQTTFSQLERDHRLGCFTDVEDMDPILRNITTSVTVDCGSRLYDPRDDSDVVVDAPVGMRGSCSKDTRSRMEDDDSEYAACHEASLFTVGEKQPDLFRASKFCASSDCMAVAYKLLRGGDIGCLQVDLPIVVNSKRAECQDPDTIDQSAVDGDAGSTGVGTATGSTKGVTTDTSTPTTESQALSTGAVIGITVGVCTVVVAVVALIAFRLWGRRQKRNDKHVSVHSPSEDGVNYTAAAEYQRHTNQKHSFSVSSTADGNRSNSTPVGGVRDARPLWEDESILAVRIPYEKISFGTLLSQGGYGEVYLGGYRDQTVAIKMLVPQRRKDMKQIENLFMEVRCLATLEHVNIVKFIGVAWDSLSETSIVLEYVSGGDLRTRLTAFDDPRSAEARPRGFDKDKIRIALHVAHALTYLHTLRPLVLHRDIKSRNILLDDELNAKITDFGTSRERADETMTADIGSILWMAPEVMTGQRYDQKADVFSFGVVLSELDTHDMPYTHAKAPGTNNRLSGAAIQQMVIRGSLQVAFSPGEDNSITALGRDCVAVNPSDRPTAAQALHRLHTISKAWANATTYHIGGDSHSPDSDTHHF